jgi:hypothetical protein
MTHVCKEQTSAAADYLQASTEDDEAGYETDGVLMQEGKTDFCHEKVR